MQCPHCLVEYHAEKHDRDLTWDADGNWSAVYFICPKCERVAIFLNCVNARGKLTKAFMVRPRSTSRAPLPTEVPSRFAADYLEACNVISDSPKASAALARRCLQDILREIAKVEPGDLYDEIQEILDSKTLPSGTADAIDAVRVVGNFAAHPLKSKQTGTIVAVEPGEAELLLEVLEELFDFYFVRPARLKARIEPINQKLESLGKPPIALRSDNQVDQISLTS